MQYRQLGGSDLKLPAVSFGAWAIGGWMWGGTDDDLAVRAIQCALDVGMTCIDTAPAYGMGHSERVVGKALRGRRDQAIIATKCGLRWDLTEGERFFDTVMPDGSPAVIYRNLRPASIRWECEQSLQRLGIDCIDLYQCHWPDNTANLDDAMDALLALKREGKIRAIGVSNFSIPMMRQCLARGPLDSDQPKYNALERNIEPEILPFCRDNNVGILAYSPIAQGFLTGRITADRVFAEGDARGNSPFYSQENRRKVNAMLEQVAPIAREYNATLGQLFTAWLLAQPGVTSALVGARNEDQVRENAVAGDLVLAPAHVQEIRKQVEALGALG